MKSHKEKLKNPKIILIGALLALFILLLVVTQKGPVEFRLEDKCGKFVNLMAHTIESEEKCRTRCLGQCQSQDMDYIRVSFEGSVSGCNQCLCYCK